jgi:nucleolar protein 9
MDSFASHVLRALLLALAPDIASVSSDAKLRTVRSKRSAAWKARQGQFTSVFAGDFDTDNGKGKNKEQSLAGRDIPIEFSQAARNLVEKVKTTLSPNEVRALAADKVASPVLQVSMHLVCS